jgi:hypothetical protein
VAKKEEKKEETKAVAVKEERAAALSADQAAMLAEFDYTEVEARDLKIPKLLLMQAMSELVRESEDVKAGDFVDSISHEKLGCVREKNYSPIKAIPIHMFKNWVIQERIPVPGQNDKLEYKETVPVTPMNTDWEWEFEQDGRKYKRTKCLNFYLLLEKDLGNPLALPHVLTFRSTSFKEGGVLANHFATCAAAKKAKVFRIPMDRFFEIGGKSKENDRGVFFVLNVKEVGEPTQEAKEQAFAWYKNILAAQKAGKSFDQKVDTSEFTGESPATDIPAGDETEF